MEINYNGYPVFKGLQKPIEFMGIRGRFLIIAAGAVGISLLSFFICAFFVGKGIGIVVMLVTAVLGYVLIFFKQKKGLHNKKKNSDIYIFKNMYIH